VEDEWLSHAKKLQAIASTGLHFGASDYDKERYAEVADIADHMLANLGKVPLKAIASLFPEHAKGYANPQIDVRGAVIRQGKILLVKECSDGLWTLPGGYADVGLSAAENTVKEVHEEASVAVQATRLYAVKHKAKHAYDADMRDFYKFYFLCEPIHPAQQPAPGPETSAAAYFSLGEIPPLSTGRIIAADLELAFEASRDPNFLTQFD
jgi:ADP-ribose pyrophosphatase YjhB (NUDIX family)